MNADGRVDVLGGVDRAALVQRTIRWEDARPMLCGQFLTAQDAWTALEPHTADDDAFCTVVDADGIADRLWRVTDEATIGAVQAALADRELLIADGHHRYETARKYAADVGGDGEHQYVLMFLVGSGLFATFFLPAVSFAKGVSAAAGEQMIQAEMANLEPADEPVSVPE